MVRKVVRRVSRAAVCGALGFHRAPAPTPSADHEAEFAAMAEAVLEGCHNGTGPAPELEYRADAPIHAFLTYLVGTHSVLLHGTSASHIDRLEPREQSVWSGEPVFGVFAASDGIWPLFFAVLDETDPPQALRNACVGTAPLDTPARRRYFFAVDEQAAARGAWSPGWVYVVPRAGFTPVAPTGLMPHEWVSSEPVRPLARVRVAPEDFPFLDDVVAFPPGESLVRTWLRRRVPGRRGSGA